MTTTDTGLAGKLREAAATEQRKGVMQDYYHDEILIAAADQLDADAARIRELTEWQPIETAPKDGSWFLGWRAARAVEDCIDTWHLATQSNGQRYWQNAADSAIDEEPTHWRPLPPPPALSMRTK